MTHHAWDQDTPSDHMYQDTSTDILPRVWPQRLCMFHIMLPLVLSNSSDNPRILLKAFNYCFHKNNKSNGPYFQIANWFCQLFMIINFSWRKWAVVLKRSQDLVCYSWLTFYTKFLKFSLNINAWIAMAVIRIFVFPSVGIDLSYTSLKVLRSIYTDVH